MNNEPHIHSFRKVAGKLYCTHPTCFKRLTHEEANGKLIKCPKCREHFLYDRSKYGPDDVVITCNKCDHKGPWELTLEVQRGLLSEILLRELQGKMDNEHRKLAQRENALEKRDDDLKLRSARLDHREVYLNALITRTAKQRFKLMTKIQLERVKLKGYKLQKETKVKTTARLTPLLQETPAGDAILDALDELLGNTPKEESPK